MRVMCIWMDPRRFENEPLIEESESGLDKINCPSQSWGLDTPPNNWRAQERSHTIPPFWNARGFSN